MSVEGGTISAGVVSAGLSVGGGEFGPGAGIGSTIVNEGSVAPVFLENTMPLTLNNFKSLGEIIFNPEAKIPPQTISVPIESGSVVDASLPSGPEAVDIVEQWLGISKPRMVEPRLEPEISGPILRPMDFVWARPEVLAFSSPELVVKPKNEPKIQPKMGQIEFSKTAPQGAGLTLLDRKSVQENAVGQNFEEEILIKEKIIEKPEVLEAEEIEELKLKDLLDEETAQQRVYEISEAIDLAETEAKKEGVDEIEGPRILKFLRLHIGLISQIARKIGKDGSLDETVEELSSRKFSSKSEAKKQSSEIVAKKEPVKRGKEGKTVQEGAVERVFKYHQVSRSPNEEVVSRVVKKQQIQTGNSKQLQVLDVEPTGVQERRIEDTPLAEVFLRKAA